MMQGDRFAVAATPQAAQSTEAAQQLYRALRSQRDVLIEQRRSVERTRDNLIQELRNTGGPGGDAVRASVEKRLVNVDARLAELDKQIAASEQNIATQAAVPGAAYTPPPPPRRGPPEEAFVLAGFLGFITLLPLTIAFARRIWRRSARAEVTLPPEMRDRMESLERGVEAIALEVERIGEGQRFVTQALSQREKVPAIGAGDRERR
jgi:hypothetical protein